MGFTRYLSLLTLLLATSLPAQEAPKLLPFQGRLSDQNGLTISNGVRLVQFKIYDVSTSGSPVWAGELHRTTVNGGLVNVLLGSKTPLTGVDFNQQLYLEITLDINGDSAITAADPPMLPRQVILPVVFAKVSAVSRESVVSRDSQKLAGYDWGSREAIQLYFRLWNRQLNFKSSSCHLGFEDRADFFRHGRTPVTEP